MSDDYIGSTSEDEYASAQMSNVSASDIYHRFAARKTRRVVAPVVKEDDFELERDRERELNRKIDKWKLTDEYRRLGPKAREMIIDSMKNKGSKHSATIMLLTTLIDKAETLWPTGEIRIPFYQQHFEMRKHKKELMDAMVSFKSVNKKNMNDSFRSRRKTYNMPKMQSQRVPSAMRHSFNPSLLRKIVS